MPCFVRCDRSRRSVRRAGSPRPADAARNFGRRGWGDLGDSTDGRPETTRQHVLAVVFPARWCANLVQPGRGHRHRHQRRARPCPSGSFAARGRTALPVADLHSSHFDRGRRCFVVDGAHLPGPGPEACSTGDEPWRWSARPRERSWRPRGGRKHRQPVVVAASGYRQGTCGQSVGASLRPRPR